MTQLLDLRSTWPEALREDARAAVRENLRSILVDTMGAKPLDGATGRHAALYEVLEARGEDCRRAMLSLALAYLGGEVDAVELSQLEFIERRLRLRLDALRRRAIDVDDLWNLAEAGVFIGLILAPLARQAGDYALAWHLGETWIETAEIASRRVASTADPGIEILPDDEEIPAEMDPDDPGAENHALVVCGWLLLVNGLAASYAEAETEESAPGAAG